MSRIADRTTHLGIYEDRSQLDHDTEQLVESLLADLNSRGVERRDGLAAVQRVVRGAR